MGKPKYFLRDVKCDFRKDKAMCCQVYAEIVDSEADKTMYWPANNPLVDYGWLYSSFDTLERATFTAAAEKFVEELNKHD